MASRSALNPCFPKMNIREINTGMLYADLPCSFEYRVNNRMNFTTAGDAYIVSRHDVEAAHPSFKLTELWLTLHNAFQQHPQHDTITLEPT